MNAEDIKNRKLTEKQRRVLRNVAARQAAGDDSSINFDDIPRLTKAQLASLVRAREVRKKVPVSVRLDSQVIDWLRSKGSGHLTRINDILTRLMEAERSQGSR